MRRWLLVTGVILSLGACGGLPRGGEEFDPLVEGLGDPEWETRREATEALESAGRPALPALARGRALEDPEIQWRSESISGAIVEEEKRQERQRLFSIPEEVEHSVRRESRTNLFLYKSERGYYSGFSQTIPFYRYKYDRRSEMSDLVIWPLVTGYRSEKVNQPSMIGHHPYQETTFYSLPLLFYYYGRIEPKETFIRSLPFFYTRSEAEERTSFWIPLILSGYTDTPRRRVVSIFPLLLHSVHKAEDSETLYIWPLLLRIHREQERYSFGLLFSLLFEYTWDPGWQEIRFFRFLRFRWRTQPAPTISYE